MSGFLDGNGEKIELIGIIGDVLGIIVVIAVFYGVYMKIVE